MPNPKSQLSIAYARPDWRRDRNASRQNPSDVLRDARRVRNPDHQGRRGARQALIRSEAGRLVGGLFGFYMIDSVAIFLQRK